MLLLVLEGLARDGGRVVADMCDVWKGAELVGEGDRRELVRRYGRWMLVMYRDGVGDMSL